MADPPSQPPRRPRRVLLFVLVQIFVIAGLLEISLRVLYDRNVGVRRLLYMSGATTAFEEVQSLRELIEGSVVEYLPNTQVGSYVLNSRSLRTKEYTEAKPDDTFRVLAIGDSFTYASGGVPYESLWHRQLERYLRGPTEQTIEVLNFGIPAVGTDFELRMWELEGAKLSADLVVLAFFIGNDFRDISLPQKEARGGTRPLVGSLLPRALRTQPDPTAGGERECRQHRGGRGRAHEQRQSQGQGGGDTSRTRRRTTTRSLRPSNRRRTSRSKAVG